jgi:hypothetical protein
MNEVGGLVPIERREYVQALMDARNGFVRQCEELEAKIAALDDEIAAACEP